MGAAHRGSLHVVGPEGAGVGASIADVARLSGVSMATVSRALRGLPNVSPPTRDRVLAAAEQLHYVADPSASRLARQRTSTIGLVVPMLGGWYHGELFRAVEHAAGEAGYDLLPFVTGSGERLQRFVRELPFRKRVDGVAVADVPADGDSARRLTEGDVPVVTCGTSLPGASSVRIDDRAAAADATAHLVALGHTDLAVIGVQGAAQPDFAVPIQRLRGVRDALAAAGLELPDHRIMHGGGYRADDGAVAMRAILDDDAGAPTAVVAFSDEMAIGAVHAARAAGLGVPDDLSVIGFDDHDVSRFVGLTTVRQDVPAIGARLTALLVDRLVDPQAPAAHEVAETRLVVRQTTGPAPGTAARATTTEPVDASSVAGSS